MSTQINDRTLKIISSSYSSLFPAGDSPEKTGDRKIKIPDKQTLERIHKQFFSGGVRAPTLADLNSNFIKYPSRQGKMESPLHFQFDIHCRNNVHGSKTPVQKLEMEKSNLSLGSLGNCRGMIKFLLPNGSMKTSEGESSKSVFDEEKDDWEKWRESVAGVRDARDVLYKYSVSRDKKIRYNSSMLPHIPKESRPWTAGEETQPKIRKNNLVLDFTKDSKSDKTHVPQPHRQSTMSRNLRRKFLKNWDNPSDVQFLEVKRIIANHDVNKGELGQYTTNVQQPFEFHGIGIPKNRMERPLKHEHLQTRPLYPSYRHYVQVPAIPVVSPTKEYKSVDVYKQYVENLQNNVNVEGQKTNIREKEKSDLSQYGQENRLLQSVINVNQPAEQADTRESNDVKLVSENDAENQTNRSNISVSKNEELHTNRSNKSIVVEIKSTWKEKENTEEHNIQEQCEPAVDSAQFQVKYADNIDPDVPRT